MAERAGRLPEGRLAFLDAVRGVAALSVALYHFGWMTPLQGTLERSLPAVLLLPVKHGRMGVPIFFVLSGFVIARSLTGATVTAGYFGRFALRRSLRLDPPYWCAVLLAVACIAVGSRFPGAPPIPSLAQVAAHFVYLQDILRFGDVAHPFWTLPFELQFYLVACGCLLLEQVLRRRGVRATIATATAHAPLALASLAVLASNRYAWGWFIDLWYMFVLGALACRALEGAWPWWCFAVFLAGVVLCGAPYEHWLSWAAAASALGIVLVGLAGRLATLGSSRALQWLGRRSYSLYLTHFVASGAVDVLARVLKPGPAGAVALVLSALGAAVVMAWAFHRLVEAPSLWLSRQERPFAVVREKLRERLGRPGARRSGAVDAPADDADTP